jgi:hypothetical protein
MPTRKEIQEVRNAVDQEIARARADLSSLQHEKSAYERKARPSLPADGTGGLHEYRGLLITDTTIGAVVAENRARKNQSAQMETLGGLGLVRILPELPQFRQMVAAQSRNIVPLFESECLSRSVLSEHEMALTSEYHQRAKFWEYARSVIGEYSAKTLEKRDSWPAGFPAERPNIDPAARLRWVAPDSPMFLSKQDRFSGCFFNMNGFVNDPMAEHNEYKDRLVWTEEETQIFVEKYKQNPKDFRRIKSALPDKCHKDVIEFYYLNRYEMGLRENEGAAKKRGGKKKVISEGNVKKSY